MTESINNITNNINELIEIMNISENILRYNSEIESDIKENGGIVLYSFNNIIIASDISDEFYNELKKNTNIEYIEDLPLKKYGDINYDLINQIDTSKFSVTNYNDIIDVTNSETTNTTTSNTTVVDGVSGKSRKNKIYNISGSTIDSSTQGLAPIITNNIFSLSASTNEWFSYEIFVDGSTPINFNFVKPTNYIGDLIIVDGCVLSGQTSKSGKYIIPIDVKNNYGYSSKEITLTIIEPVIITNTNIESYNKYGTQFSYVIESSGNAPKYYDVPDLASGLTLNNNIISGTFLEIGVYNMTIIVSGLTNSDYKNITVNVGEPPIITSSGSISHKQYSGLTYNITSNSLDCTYNVIGILPEGLKFSVDVIEGTPTYVGISNLKIKATNHYGESYKDLSIMIYKIS